MNSGRLIVDKDGATYGGVGGDDHLPVRVVLAFKRLAGPVQARACARAGAGGSVGSTYVSGCRKCSGIGHGD